MKRKILYALLSLVISFGLWLYVITYVSPGSEDTFYNIPVVLTNETILNDRGLMLTQQEALTVTLQLSGNRSDLAKLSSSNITVTADLSRVISAGQQVLDYSVTFPGEVSQNAIEILNQTPASVTVSIAERKTKEVPVVPVYEGAVPEGFLTDTENVVTDVEAVTIVGPAKVVEQIEQAVIVVNLEGQTETISQSYTYTLCDAEGEPVDAQLITTDTEEINLTLTIQRYKEIQLTLNVITGGGATLKNTEITMDAETLLISGSEQMLESVEDTLVLGDLKLAEVLEDTTLEYEIKLPEGVTNLSGLSKVTVDVTFQGLVKKTVEVSNILARNVPENMEVTLLTRVVSVVLRGPSGQIEVVDGDDLVIVVDFSGASLGTDTYKAIVSINNSELADLGTVGSYTVSATVTEKTEEELDAQTQ